MFLERCFDPAIAPNDVFAMGAEGAECFGLYGIAWHGSLLATDGGRMLCHFEGPDAESVRVALRQLGVTVEGLWPGTAHTAPGTTPAEQAAANVLVARAFEEPVALEDVQRAEDANAWCLEAHNVNWVRTYFSRDRQRMMCVYRAPDAEAVRRAQQGAGLPFQAVWAVTPIRPPG